MSRTVLINGAPGSGKSTVARALSEDRPLTLVLDLDTVRGSLGRWPEDPTAAGLAARALGLAMAETHLRAGHDVIVPQFLARPHFVAALEELCVRTDAELVEIALVSDPVEAARRLADRAGSADPNHRAARMLRARPDARPVEELYRDMLEVLRDRPATHYVHTRTGDVAGTCAAVRAVLAG